MSRSKSSSLTYIPLSDPNVKIVEMVWFDLPAEGIGTAADNATGGDTGHAMGSAVVLQWIARPEVDSSAGLSLKFNLGLSLQDRPKNPP